MQKITPHLWYDKEAKEAAEFYTSIFPDSRIINLSTLHDTPSGDADMVSMELVGQQFMAISAGPYFKFTPAISFLVACKTKEQVDEFWSKLSDGGSALMEIGSYPFSERYGWLKDRYGLSWQLMYAGEQEIKQNITPTLMFVGNVCGKTEEAINFYCSVFHNSSINHIMRYGPGQSPEAENTIQHAGFTLENQQFAAMDSAREHKFTFTEAISFMVNCDTQAEIDYYWEKLSAVPEAEQCGWLKDKYGVSWQVVPSMMNQLLTSNDKEKVTRVTQSFLKMKKFDIAELQKAADGN